MCIGSEMVGSTKRTEVALAVSHIHAFKLLLSNLHEVYWFKFFNPLL